MWKTKNRIQEKTVEKYLKKMEWYFISQKEKIVWDGGGKNGKVGKGQITLETEDGRDNSSHVHREENLQS